ncbi:FxDxF family PEP-CTERM protein [Qipengyuania sp.]|uniref:FxDxF family PEP-CTERM protein n=1 Tax=Qipengyuania sp. TaxID=2004515 RepID=UPI0035C7C40F
MKLTLTAIALAGAATALAAPAHAATTVSYPGGSTVALSASPSGQTLVGSFAAEVAGSGDFSSTFSFSVPTAGVVSIAGISILSGPSSDIDFTSGLLDNTIPFSISNGFIDIANVALQAIGAGTHSFTLNGQLKATGTTGKGGFGGNISFAQSGAVPEPTTWALFILGFGLIGGAMRRQTTRHSKLRAAISFS